MLSISEDEKPKFNFGRDEEECDEIKEWIGHFKTFPPALDTKYLNMMFVHDRAESSSIHNLPPCENTFDLQMPEASKAPNSKFQFGINTMNNLLSQMPNQHVLNIQCQSQNDIKTAIMLGQWTLSKRTQDDTLTGQQLVGQIIAGLSGLANEWWRWLPQEARNEMLSTEDVDQ